MVYQKLDDRESPNEIRVVVSLYANLSTRQEMPRFMHSFDTGCLSQIRYKAFFSSSMS
jgi:hypothetical protein